MTTVYYTFCKQLPQTEYRNAISLLPESMRQRIHRYRRWQDSHAYLYGRLLLKEAMFRLGYNYSLESMKKTKYGKPYFIDSSFTFNISHSGEYVICVISTDEKEQLGIDIEKIKPIVIDDFDFIFSPLERKVIDSYEKFYKCWTSKEAVVKADGRGLRIPLETIDTTSQLLKLQCNEYHIANVFIDNQYVVKMASLTKLENIRTVNFLPSIIDLIKNFKILYNVAS